MTRRRGIYGFYSELYLVRPVGRDVWALSRPLEYRSAGLGRYIRVPAGFATDFASIPRLLWRVLPKNGIYDAPAVLHDWGYQNLSRIAADGLFHESMIIAGVSRWKAFLMFLAVRLFGRAAYKGKHDAV